MLHKRNIFRCFMLGLLTLILSSCSTIMRDNIQSIPIKANVEDVDIKITNKNGDTVFKGKTPTVVSLKTSQNGYFSPEKYNITATKVGYEGNLQTIDSHVSNWYIFGNIGFWGLLGYLVVDPISGDMYYLDEEVNIHMTPIPNNNQ